MGGTHGFAGMPNKKVNILASVFGKGWETMADFYMVGQWVTSAGALFSNALSGRTVIRALCKQQARGSSRRR